MKRVTLWVFAALLVVAFVKPSLVDSAFQGAFGLGSGSGSAATSAPTSPAPTTASGPAAAQDYATAAQKKADADAKVGTLGVNSGADHHAEMNPGYRWSTCAPVRFVLNTKDAPAGAVDDFNLALRKLNGATNLKLEVVGKTSATPTDEWPRSAGQNTFRPVLVAWGKPGTSILGPHASGTAYPYGTRNAHGERVYVSGLIVFNAANDRIYTPGFGAFGSRTLLYMHEVSHILGLDHVADKNQMMAKSVSTTVDAGAGDLAGLRAAGSGGCMDQPRP